MKIAVCLKRVPEMELRFSIAGDRKSLDPGGLKYEISDFDGYALEVALLETGKPWSTKELARKLDGWMQLGAPVALLVGGPDGLSPDCVARADERWSLSSLTLPHGLVRVVVAEALYRAWSLLENHPYHRA